MTKAIMLSERAYQRLDGFKRVEQSKSGKEYSYSDVVLGLLDLYETVVKTSNGVAARGQRIKSQEDD